MSLQEYHLLALKRPWVPQWLFRSVAKTGMAFHWEWLCLLVVCGCDRCLDGKEKIEGEPWSLRRHWS